MMTASSLLVEKMMAQDSAGTNGASVNVHVKATEEKL